jgi:hypothetical protein
MTKKKAFIEHSVKFALWLVKACIVVSALTGAVIAASIFVWQGTMFLVKEHGILWALPVLVCSGMILHLMWSECSQSKQEEAKVERGKAAPDKPESRWRKGAPTTLTKVPLSRWTFASLTILRQIELALGSNRFYASDTHGALLRDLRPEQPNPDVFVSATNSAALREFIRNGGRAHRVRRVNGGCGKPIISIPGYSVWFRFANANDELAGPARSIKSEAQAEIDRRALENKKEAHRD